MVNYSPFSDFSDKKNSIEKHLKSIENFLVISNIPKSFELLHIQKSAFSFIGNLNKVQKSLKVHKNLLSFFIPKLLTYSPNLTVYLNGSDVEKDFFKCVKIKKNSHVFQKFS